MPWSIEKRGDEYCVINDSSGGSVGCHATRDEAESHQRALYASEDDAALSPQTFNHEDAIALLNQAITALQGPHAPAQVREILVEATRMMESYEEDIEQEAEEAPDVSSFSMEQQEGVLETHAWEGPVTYEGLFTGDKRFFKEGAVVWNEDLLPFPFKWQRVSADGHDASITIGRVDRLFRGEGGAIHGEGVIFVGDGAPSEGNEYFSLLLNEAAGGVSIDGDDAEFEVLFEESDEGDVENLRMEFSRINVRALTAVDIPAFAGAKIRLTDQTLLAAPIEIEEFIRRQDDRPSSTLFEAVLASAIPCDPPSEWFNDPEFSELTPITISDEGRISGHLAGMSCHIGYGSCTTPPRGCDYDNYFHLGALKSLEGSTIHVGHMTFGGGHAPTNLSAREAADRYDSTSKVSADIRCGEDEFGTWVVGALRPGLSPEELREVRSAPLSGDWRIVAGKHQLIAAHGVNVPGFPVPRVRALVASGGETQTLIIAAPESCECDEEKSFDQMLLEMEIEEEI